jgi:hypothetical protein
MIRANVAEQPDGAVQAVVPQPPPPPSAPARVPLWIAVSAAVAAGLVGSGVAALQRIDALEASLFELRSAVAVVGARRQVFTCAPQYAGENVFTVGWIIEAGSAWVEAPHCHIDFTIGTAGGRIEARAYGLGTASGGRIDVAIFDNREPRGIGNYPKLHSTATDWPGLAISHVSTIVPITAVANYLQPKSAVSSNHSLTFRVRAVGNVPKVTLYGGSMEVWVTQ